MAAAVVLLLVDDVAEGAHPRAGQDREVHGEVAEAELDAGRPRPYPVPVDLVLAAVHVVDRLVVDPDAGGGARRAEPVEADPGAHLVVRPGVRVRPVVQLLVDPGQAGHGAVRQPVAERLRLGGLLQVVAAPFLLEPPVAGYAVLLSLVVRRYGVLQGEDGVL